MKRTFGLSIVTAAVALLTASSVAKAGLAKFSLPPVQPALVTPGDTFSMRISGYSFDQTSVIFLTPVLTATFGATQTFAGSGPTLGQTITVSSSEVIGATTTTDTFTISVPTNFDPAGTTTNGTTPVGLIFAFLGEFDAGANPVNFALPITSPVYAGTFTYSAGTQAGTQTATLGAGNTTYASYLGVNAGGADLASFAIRGFSYSITYPNAVPEPSTYALSGLALAGGFVCFVRRRRSAV